MPNLPTAEMGRLHELHAAEIFGGRKTRGSGSQWNDQLDGVNVHDDPLAFRWDCKSTLAASLTITLAMIAKATEQAQGERPAIPLRWYASTSLTEIAADWVAMKDVDVSEILDEGRQARALRQDLAARSHDLEVTRRELARVREALEAANAEVRARDARSPEIPATRPELALPDVFQPPRLPWTVVNAVHEGGSIVHGGFRYAEDGLRVDFQVDSKGVRIERTATNRPRLIVNDCLVFNGDLYIDGKLHARVCAADPSIEVG